MTLYPEPLKPGDAIGIIAPGSPLDLERLENGINYLESRGYKTRPGKSLREMHGYLAGADEKRAADVNEMFENPDIKAIFCARGGYGTPRILSLIDYDVIKRNPKILVGYSDITALHLAVYKETKLVSFAGPMVAVEMGIGIDPFTETHFWSMVTQPNATKKLANQDNALQILKPGQKKGRLLGGNLAMICALIGTPYLPDFNGAILVVEDIAEEPYKIDRMFMQLKFAGILNELNGLVLGQFIDCKPTNDKPSFSVVEIVQQLTSESDFPILSGLPFGHGAVKYTVPLGVEALLDGENGCLDILGEFPA